MPFFTLSRAPVHGLLLSLVLATATPMSGATRAAAARERLLITEDWRFHRGDAPGAGDGLDYPAMRAWLLPTGAHLINAGSAAPVRPTGAEPGRDIPFVRPDFDDSGWRRLDIPHDWGIEGPFMQERPGDTGKLPWQGVGWYRKTLPITAADEGRRIYLDIDGAMAYSAVWLNGRFVGGWPYGYTSYRLDLTPHVDFRGKNVLAVRLDNPDDSSRWYPGSGLYRNVWLVKSAPVHVAQWGVYVTTPIVSAEEAVVKVDVQVDNTTDSKVSIALTTAIHELGADLRARCARHGPRARPGGHAHPPAAGPAAAPVGSRQPASVRGGDDGGAGRRGRRPGRDAFRHSHRAL